MGKKMPIFYNALLLTGVNLILRFVSTSFQVFLSGRIGAEGVGLLQLILSVGALSMTIGMGGIRTATMYLSAEVVGQKRQEHMIWVLSGCIAYSIVLSSAVSLLLYHFSPQIAHMWIGDNKTAEIIRLLAAFIPVNCLCGVMTGYYTGINRIGTLAIVEVMEQLLSMLFTTLLLTVWAGSHIYKACLSVVMGSGLGGCFTLTTLLLLKRKERATVGKRISIRNQLWDTAVPLAVADTVKSGISTTENLMVPKRLTLYPEATNPLAAFGMVCGMVFPVLMFPASIMFGLAELLIPELARCKAAGSKMRIRYLAEKSLKIALIYGCYCAGILFLNAESLCNTLYATAEAGKYLKWYALLAPMLYADAIVDAIIKGLGQQKITVRYNIITSAMDVILLFILLPHYGMTGYFISFFITHFINFLLSCALLKKMVDKAIRLHTLLSCTITTMTGIFALSYMESNILKAFSYTILFLLLQYILGGIKNEDIEWIKGLTINRK